MIWLARTAFIYTSVRTGIPIDVLAYAVFGAFIPAIQRVTL